MQSNRLMQTYSPDSSNAKTDDLNYNTVNKLEQFSMTHCQQTKYTNLVIFCSQLTNRSFGKIVLIGLVCYLLILGQHSNAQDADRESAQTKVFDMVFSEEPEVSEQNSVPQPSLEEIDSVSEQTDSDVPSDIAKVEAAPDNRTTAEKLEDLKEEVLAVNRDLFILEEDLLFPASTQVAAYFSVDIGYFFSLDNIKLKIDDKQVTHYLYTQKDVDALYRGAIQKVYLGNVSTGEHEMVAILIGHGPHNREYRVAVNYTFEKGTEAKALEIQLRDDTGKLQPKLNLVEW